MTSIKKSSIDIFNILNSCTNDCTFGILMKDDPISTVWSFNDSSNKFVLKKPKLETRINEGIVTNELNKQWSNVLPEVCTYNENCFIQPFIKSKKNILYSDLFEILKNYSKMQIESTAQKKYFELFGVTDFSLDIFEAKFKLLINTNESCGYGIIFNERDKTLILRKISFLVRKIQKFGIPMTLEHGDLHLANFVGTNSSSIRIIDWSEVSYTHPFFSLYFLFWNSNKLSASLKKSLTISYLSEWSSFGSILDLQKLLSYTNQLAIIFYAYRYLIIANKLSGDLREDFMSFFQNQMAAFKNIAGPNDV